MDPDIAADNKLFNSNVKNGIWNDTARADKDTNLSNLERSNLLRPDDKTAVFKRTAVLNFKQQSDKLSQMDFGKDFEYKSSGLNCDDDTNCKYTISQERIKNWLNDRELEICRSDDIGHGESLIDTQGEDELLRAIEGLGEMEGFEEGNDISTTSSTTRLTKLRLSSGDKSYYCSDGITLTKETIECGQTLFRVIDGTNWPMINNCERDKVDISLQRENEGCSPVDAREDKSRRLDVEMGRNGVEIVTTGRNHHSNKVLSETTDNARNCGYLTLGKSEEINLSCNELGKHATVDNRVSMVNTRNEDKISASNCRKNICLTGALKSTISPEKSSNDNLKGEGREILELSKTNGTNQLITYAKKEPRDLFVFDKVIDREIELTSDEPSKSTMNLIKSCKEKDYSLETDLCSRAERSSIVEVSIAPNNDVISADSEKWRVEIFSDSASSDRLSLDFSDYSEDSEREIELLDEEITRSTCLEQRDVYNKCSAEKDLSCAAHNGFETIGSIGGLNLILKQKGGSSDSIQNQRLSSHFAISENLHADSNLCRNLEKMSRHKLKDSSAKELNSDKTKLINPGQGVQLRVNVKKQIGDGERTEIPPQSVSKKQLVNTQNVSTKQKSIVSSARAVSVKSLVKGNENMDAEYNSGNSDSINMFMDFNPQESYLDTELKETLSEIVNFRPPDIAGDGIGRVENDSSQQIYTSEERLKMENSRLSLLLINVERARTATVKTLLQVHTVLNEVHRDNARLEGNLKTLSTEKKFLQEDLQELRENSEKCERENTDFLTSNKATEFESSMKMILGSWKKEKRELLNALSLSTTKLKNAEIDAISLRAQFSKVKGQLENSNATFDKLLEHNLQASEKMEHEIEYLQEEKRKLIETIAEKSKDSEKVANLKDEISSLKDSLERANDEKDDLSRKVTDLEKSNKKAKQQYEELQDELDHSQDIVGKLASTEEMLKEKLEKEISEKTYLQDCLDETGQILRHLRGTEEKLRTEKDELEEDLEEEMQANESLQQSLKTTRQEHQSLISRLQDMTKVHMTVKESLQQAGKKEQTYQQQIASLQRTNNILHYASEKEKEEKMDLQEMLDNTEWQSRNFKESKIGEVLDLQKQLSVMAETEAALTIKTERLEKENIELRTHLEQEEEDNDDLRRKVSKLEKYKDVTALELENLHQKLSDYESEVADIKKRIEDLTKALKKEKDQYDNLVCTLEETEESLDKVTKEAGLARDQASRKEKEAEDVRGQLKEKCKALRELEINVEFEAGEKERYQNRCKSHEIEVKKLRKKVTEEQEEVEVSKLHVKRLERELFSLKKNHEEKMREFDLQKNKSAEHLQRTKEELVGMQNQLVEKDRLAMKQKENFQDAIENTAADLKLLRDFLGDSGNTDKGSNLLREVLQREGGGIDIDFLRNAHHKTEEEMLRDVSHLEGMLKVSKEEKQTVTVLRSPMSKIKLDEIKQLRDEMYALNSEVGKIKERLADLSQDFDKTKSGKAKNIMGLNQGLRESISEKPDDNNNSDIRYELKLLDETLKNIENNHRYLIERNKGIIDSGILKVSRENSLDELDSASESSHDDEEKEGLKRDIINASLAAENLQLKRSLELMQRRYGSIDAFFDNASLRNETLAADRRDIGLTSLHKGSACVADDYPGSSNENAKKPTRKYLPPTSMRYPPKLMTGNNARDTVVRSGSARDTTTSGYQSNDSSDGGRNAAYNFLTNPKGPKQKGLFSSEMSSFHNDNGVAGDKRLDKRTLTDSRSDTASAKSALSVPTSATICLRRRGSLDDDENDEDSDAPQFRRSRTLPRKFKNRSSLGHKK